VVPLRFDPRGAGDGGGIEEWVLPFMFAFERRGAGTTGGELCEALRAARLWIDFDFRAAGGFGLSFFFLVFESVSV
jgi:hypothetical protein